MTLARTPYARLSPADIGQVDRELKKLEQMSAGLYVPKVLVHARSPYTVQGTDTMLLCDCTAGPVTLTFPLAARVDGMCVQVVKSDTSANAVTLSGTFSGVASPTLTVQDSGFTIMAMNGAYRVTAFVPCPIVTGETGVTSIFYAYGDVRRYGAKLDGVTNDRAAFVAADASATLGIGGVSRVIQPTGTALIGSNLTLVNPFRPYPGAKVRPANAVVVTMNGSIHAGLYQWIDTILGGKVVFAKGSVVSIHPHWWGPISAFDTTWNTMLAALNTGNTTWNPRVRMPSGDYVLGNSVNGPNSLANVESVGDGPRSTRVLWAGPPGVPMAKWTNARNLKFKGIGVMNTSGNAPSAGFVYDSVTAGKTATPINCTHHECFFGGDSAAAMQIGVYYTSSDASDQNNEQHKFSACEFYNCSVAGVRIGHSNSLWHKFTKGCYFTGCAAGISNYMGSGATYGGGYSVSSCSFTSCDAVFEVGPSLYPIEVVNSNAETCGYLIHTPSMLTTGVGGFHIVGGKWECTTATGLRWDSSVPAGGTDTRLVLDNVMMRGSAGTTLYFGGTDPVFIIGGDYNFGTVTYNGTVTIRGIWLWLDWSSFTTQLSSTGILVIESEGMTTNTITLGTVTANVASVLGYPKKCIVKANYGVATQINNLSGGFNWQEITILAVTANLTVHPGGFILLRGNRDFAMSANDTLTLVSQGGAWYEKSRKVAAAVLADMGALATTQTAGATYTANEQTMLTNLKTDVTTLRTLVNQLLANRRAVGEQL